MCVASIVQREQKVFFCLLQDESGDLFRLTLSEEEEGSSSSVSAITLTYFDTIPVCTSMCISRNGLLFATSEVSIDFEPILNPSPPIVFFFFETSL